MVTNKHAACHFNKANRTFLSQNGERAMHVGDKAPPPSGEGSRAKKSHYSCAMTQIPQKEVDGHVYFV